MTTLMTPAALLGYLAASFAFATFCTKRVVPLRVLAIAGNIAFIGCGYLGELWPIVILQAALLLPLNIYRLRAGSVAGSLETAKADLSDVHSRQHLLRDFGPNVPRFARLLRGFVHDGREVAQPVPATVPATARNLASVIGFGVEQRGQGGGDRGMVAVGAAFDPPSEPVGSRMRSDAMPRAGRQTAFRPFPVMSRLPANGWRCGRLRDVR